MLDRRLVLPRDVPGANAFACAGCAHVALADFDDDSASPVVLVVPSLLQLLQAGWLSALRATEWGTFATWLDASTAAERPSWRYDLAVSAWADAVGAERVHLVAGNDAARAAEALGRLSGQPESPPVIEGWTRALSWAEVGTVEALVAELEELGLTGRNAADMVDGGAEQLMRSGAAVRLGAHPLPADLDRRLADLAATMTATVEATGVQVTGDRAALAWPPQEPEGAGRVGVAEAAILATGLLERVASWGEGESA